MSRRSDRSDSRGRRGVHAVEFALILPVWFGLIAAIMDFGWIFFHVSILDAAANMGCRAGSLVDPGDNDERIYLVEQRTFERMREVLTVFGAGECEDCTVEAHTVGDPPSRSLVCTVTRPVDPITHLYFTTRTLVSTQVSRLEWQRQAAPPS